MIRLGARYVAPDGTLTHEGVAVFQQMESDIAAFAAVREAIAAIPPATGGAVIDVEARAELAAIRAALG